MKLFTSLCCRHAACAGYVRDLHGNHVTTVGTSASGCSKLGPYPQRVLSRCCLDACGGHIRGEVGGLSKLEARGDNSNDYGDTKHLQLARSSHLTADAVTSCTRAQRGETEILRQNLIAQGLLTFKPCKTSIPPTSRSRTTKSEQRTDTETPPFNEHHNKSTENTAEQQHHTSPMGPCLRITGARWQHQENWAF